ASRSRSPGRISAPFHAQTSSAITTAQPNAEASVRFGGRKGTATAVAAVLKSILRGAQLRGLRVDVGGLVLALGVRHRRVALDLVALLEVLELPDRHELRVRRFAESAVVVDVLEDRLLLRVALGVVHDEGLELRLDGGIEVRAPDERIRGDE